MGKLSNHLLEDTFDFSCLATGRWTCIFFAHQKLSDRRHLQDLLGNGIKKKRRLYNFASLERVHRWIYTRSDAKQMAPGEDALSAFPVVDQEAIFKKHKLVKG